MLKFLMHEYVLNVVMNITKLCFCCFHRQVSMWLDTVRKNYIKFLIYGMCGKCYDVIFYIKRSDMLKLLMHEYVLNVVMNITKLCFVVITGRSVCGMFLVQFVGKLYDGIFFSNTLTFLKF